MWKKLFLKMFPEANAFWLELMIDNPGLRKNVDCSRITRVLKRADFSLSSLDFLAADLNRSRSAVKYNSNTDNGLNYDRALYGRYGQALNTVEAFIRERQR